MTEPKPLYQTEEQQQLAAKWYMIMQQAHEAGLIAQRQLIEMNALPDGNKLFLTRKERRGMPE